MKKNYLSATRVIMLGFLIGAFLGSIILSLPVSLKENVNIKYIDALFVAVSGVCVTGLSTVNIGQTFSLFGQFILLIIIQMGGLGIVTFTTMLLVLFKKKINLQNRILIQSAYNLDTLAGLVKLTFRVIKATLYIEGIGAILYAFVFIPEFGPIGIWYSIFHSVSAFCNAGIDLLGGNSFCIYRDNLWINLTTMYLIIAGGLGFPVYWELERIFKVKTGKVKDTMKLSFHAKLVIFVTIILIVAGTLITLIFEYNNPDTIGNLDLPHKILASTFQSVTLRTAGFATIDQSMFRSSSCLGYIVIMFIGGSPAGTAGGVKTITVVLLCASVVSNIKGKKDVVILNRRITDEIIRRCVAIIVFSFSVLLVLSCAVLAVEQFDFLDVMYEMTSAIATVGLSRGMTGELHSLGKIILILAMYLGRIGPITLALAFNTKKTTTSASYAEGKTIIG